MARQGCSGCFFLGMEPDEPYSGGGHWRYTCAVWGRRRKGGCAGWRQDPGEMATTGPNSRDVQAARDACAEGLRTQAGRA